MSTKMSTRCTPRALFVIVQGTITCVTYVNVHFDHWITLNVWTSVVWVAAT